MINGDDPAFPAPEWNISFVGMSLRDYFAAQALAGMTSCPEKWISVGQDQLPRQTQMARKAYIYADAMLTARIQK